MANKNILLIEPGYKNKYPPLGLMKISQYHKEKGDVVKFIKGENDTSVLEQAWDRIYVTTLFTFEWKNIERSIDFAVKVSNGQPDKVFVGGIAASLLNDEFYKEYKWSGVRFIKGLLDQPPAISLELDDFAEELYSEDQCGVAIEDLAPDYGILDQIDYTYHVRDGYFLYASRGCVRKCHFCGVPKLEGAQRDAGSIKDKVSQIIKNNGEKKDLIFMDNNIVASPRYKEIIDEIVDLGFEKGATIRRDGRDYSRRVDFNQGIDARILCKDDMYLREMSRICVKPLRIAFDHVGLKGPYTTAIRQSKEYGITELSNYMLYNFTDSPEDLYERLRINIDLNEQYDIRIYSFPMRYQPITMKDRTHIGEHWNKYYLRSFQIMLQATHGIASGAPEFFRRAYGSDFTSFEKLLCMPQHFIHNRNWYEKYGGMSELEEFRSSFNKLSTVDRAELMDLLSANTPSGYLTASKGVNNKRVKDILQFYYPLPSDVERKIWEESKKLKSTATELITLPQDEKVEDAGLNEDEDNTLVSEGYMHAA